MKPLSIHYAAFYFIRKVMKLIYSLQGNKYNTKKKTRKCNNVEAQIW